MKILPLNKDFGNYNFIRKSEKETNELREIKPCNNNFATYVNSYNTAFMGRRPIVELRSCFTDETANCIATMLEKKFKAAKNILDSVNGTRTPKNITKSKVNKTVVKPTNTITTSEGITHKITLDMLRPDTSSEVKVAINSTNTNGECIAKTEIRYNLDGKTTYLNCESTDGKRKFTYKVPDKHTHSKVTTFEQNGQITTYRPTKGANSDFKPSDFESMERDIASISGTHMAEVLTKTAIRKHASILSQVV